MTDATGAYPFTTLQPGTYTMTVQLPGSGRSHARNPGDAEQRRRASTPGCRLDSSPRSVTVSGERPLLQTDRAEVRSELKAQELVNLPVSINRNYQ